MPTRCSRILGEPCGFTSILSTFVGSKKQMKILQILIVLAAGSLALSSAIAESSNTNSVVILESVKSKLQPQTNVIYKIAPNWIYKTDNPGPPEFETAHAWSLANEFVFRTGLRDSLDLPAQSAGKQHKDLYSVTFGTRNNGKEVVLFVDPKAGTVRLNKKE